MKSTKILAIALVSSVLASLFYSCGSASNAKGVKLKNSVDSLSYAAGVVIGKDMAEAKLPALNSELVKQGAVDYLDSNKALDIASIERSYGTLARKMQMEGLDKDITGNTELEETRDSMSYYLGALLAYLRAENGMAGTNPDALSKGLTDVADSTLDISLDNCRDMYTEEAEGAQRRKLAEREAQMQQRMAEMEAAAEEYLPNKELGQKFLEENLKNSGVASTPSGLQYRVIKSGNGRQPAATSRVKVHYTGKTIDGEVFDSSVERGEPTEFGLNQVIRGWTEGLMLMSEGGKYEFFIPQELAYGVQSPTPKIKPYSTLIFEVELLEIVQP